MKKENALWRQVCRWIKREIAKNLNRIDILEVVRGDGSSDNEFG